MKWEPISTAPMGKRVLVYAGGWVQVGCYEVERAYTREDEGWYGDDARPVEPTHWMPLPDPPAGQG